MRSIYNRILLATVLITGLSIGATAIATNAQGSTNTTPGNSLKGSLTSIQSDDNNTSWIVSGAFRMDNMNSTTTTSPTFNATFYMMKTDGTAPHKHDIYDLQMTGQPTTKDNSTIFNGTSTVTMKDGPVQDVPTSVALMDDSAASVWLDPAKVNKHFGDTLIYGTQHLVCVESPGICN
jgi:hypothetical protein